MSLRDVRISLTKARRYYAAGMYKYALRDLMRAERAYEKVTVGLREKLQEAENLASHNNEMEVLAKAAYDYSELVEKAIETGQEIEQFRNELAATE